VVLAFAWLQFAPAGEPVRDPRAETVIDALWGMDANQDGQLDAQEISEQARPYIEHYASLARLDPAKPLSLSALGDAVYAYHRARGGPYPNFSSAAFSEGSGAGDDEGVPGFGPTGDDPIPGFGDENDTGVRIKINEADLKQAAERFREHDRNRDGFLDGRELERERWYGNPLDYDKNGDKRLSKQEMALRYATRRETAADRGHQTPEQRWAEEQRKRAEWQKREEERRRNAEAAHRREQEEARQRHEAEERKRREQWGDRGTWELVGNLMQRYDANRDGDIDRVEWRKMAASENMGDANPTGDVVDRRELYLWVRERTDRTKVRLPHGLPLWFNERDLNGDGQVAMSEFTDEWTDEKAQEFALYDQNQDGVLMPDECLGEEPPPPGQVAFESRQFKVIPARGTISSQITVNDEMMVGDLDVRISVTHSHVSWLDAYLVGPSGQRIELFTGVGDHDDHFNNTILDDEAETPITRGRPPFAGRYQPESVEKKQPSLSSFYDRRIRGTWILVIGGWRSERPGSLHGWALLARSVADVEAAKAEAEAAAAAAASENSPSDGPSNGPDQTERRPPDGQRSPPSDPERRPERAPSTRRFGDGRTPWGGR